MLYYKALFCEINLSETSFFLNAYMFIWSWKYSLNCHIFFSTNFLNCFSWADYLAGGNLTAQLGFIKPIKPFITMLLTSILLYYPQQYFNLLYFITVLWFFSPYFCHFCRANFAYSLFTSFLLALLVWPPLSKLLTSFKGKQSWLLWYLTLSYKKKS